jgi:hypothetical protein
MTHRANQLLLSIVLAVAALLATAPASATVPWTQQQIADYERTHPPLPYSPEHHERPSYPNRTLDDPIYFENFAQTCEFLTTLQNFNPGADFGGMREGEVGNDLDIIQTDNTQEAIRDWCQYALWTGDTATYSENVRAAWEYCNTHPAWMEEIDTGVYYRDHNCGWGIEAVILFSAAYGDTSHNVYADACCNHMASHTPSAANLDQYAYALGLGGMYQWAVIRNHQGWINWSIQQGFALRDWLTVNPTRIRGTSWALCGGTAVWGLCRSLFAAYPDTGRVWVAQFGEQLPTASEVPASSWYNSFKCWNSNATFACSQLSDDPVYTNRVVDHADNLLSFDLDDDGGIPPGTCCISDGNDHSWVSAYMAWMALGNMIDGLSRIISPDPAIPHPAGTPLQIIADIYNPSLEATSGTARVFGYGLDIDAPFTLASGENVELPFMQPWVLPDDNTLPDENSLTLVVEMIYPEETIVDTVVTSYDIRRQVDITGEIRGEFDIAEMPPCRIEFSNIERPDTVYIPIPTQTGETYTSGDAPIFTGNIRIRVIPPVRYTILDTIINVQTIDQAEAINLFLTTTTLVLVDDDGGASYETYIESALSSLNYNTRVWDQTLDHLTDADSLRTIIWMTGGNAESGPSSTVIDLQEQEFIETFLNSGGKLLMTGQDITDALRDDPFLENVLHCAAANDTVNRNPISGDGLDPVFGNTMIILSSGKSAPNQYSTASLTPLEGAQLILIYPTAVVAAIKGTHGGGRFILTGFGIEGMPETSTFTDRADFLELCFDWLNEGENTDSYGAFLPTEISLNQNYPNPFNPATTISFYAPPGTGTMVLLVYDILGREVANLFEGIVHDGFVTLTWDGKDYSGRTVASGTYVYTLTGNNRSISRSMQLVR